MPISCSLIHHKLNIFTMTYDEMTQQIESGNAYYDRSYPGGAWVVDDCYYNRFGQQLRDPEEYNTNSEGYTPFGDE